MSEERAQLELFGEESKNVFSAPRKVGVLELANMGTLFIDEVSDLPLNVQSKLLNFLQSHSFARNGGKNMVKLDVRIVSSTGKDLKEEIAKGRFREDLFYRLNVIQVPIPALSERKDDLPMLCEFFIKYFHEYIGFPLRKLSAEALVIMQTYAWPGNVRQLRNVIEWLLIMNNSEEGQYITASMLPPEITNKPLVIEAAFSEVKSESLTTGTEVIDLPLREAREVFEKQYLATQLIRFDNNITKMASAIGMERSALHRKLKTLEIAQDA